MAWGGVLNIQNLLYIYERAISVEWELAQMLMLRFQAAEPEQVNCRGQQKED